MTSSASGDPIVMQSRDYTCGPAALATVLKSLGIPAVNLNLPNLQVQMNQAPPCMA